MGTERGKRSPSVPRHALRNAATSPVVFAARLKIFPKILRATT
jgi:hypothetical protein